MPVFHLDDVQIDANFIFGVEHLGEFAERHRVARGHGKISDKVELVRVENGAFDGDAVERIGAVENVK